MMYVGLILVLGVLGSAYLYFPPQRLLLAAIMGLSYFIWGIWAHKKALHWQIVLEYFVLALLGMSLLIFLSLRA